MTISDYEAEIHVYRILMFKGRATAEQLALGLELEAGQVYRALGHLKELGVVLLPGGELWEISPAWKLS